MLRPILVGRDAEMGLLLQRWQLARQGRGQLVVLTGEADELEKLDCEIVELIAQRLIIARLTTGLKRAASLSITDSEKFCFGGEVPTSRDELVRLPVDQDGLHCIPLYDEVPVAVLGADRVVLAADRALVAGCARLGDRLGRAGRVGQHDDGRGGQRAESAKRRMWGHPPMLARGPSPGPCRADRSRRRLVPRRSSAQSPVRRSYSIVREAFEGDRAGAFGEGSMAPKIQAVVSNLVPSPMNFDEMDHNDDGVITPTESCSGEATSPSCRYCVPSTASR